MSRRRFVVHRRVATCESCKKPHTGHHHNEYLAQQLAEEAARECDHVRYIKRVRREQYRADNEATSA